MKKKLLLAVAIVAILVCLFAIGVSAQRVEDYEDTFTLVNSSTVQHYERHYYNETQYHKRVYTDSITVRFIDEDGNDLTTVPMWEYDEEEGRYYSLVWYISASEFGKETATTVISDVEYTYDKYTSAVYTLSKVRAVDIRYDHTYSESWSFSTSSVGYDYTYKVQKPLWGMFLDVNNTPDNKDDDYVLQASRGTGRDTSDYGYIGWDAQFASQGNKIVVANFRDCDFDADCTGNYGTKNTWSLATNLQCLWYPDTVKYLCGGTQGYEIDLGDGVEIINCQVLRSNKKIKEFVIPNSCIYLGNESFRETDLTTLVIGEGLITCPGNNAFLYTGGADNVYISKNILKTYVNGINSLVANKSATIYFDGDLEDAEELMANIIGTDSNYKITLVDYNETQERGNVANVCLFYNYNTCEAFYRGVHTNGVTYGFDGEDKYTSNFCMFDGCTRCTEKQTTSYGALFTNKGYSKEDGSASFSYGIVFNMEAIALYEEKMTATFDYGFVVGSVPAETDGKIVNADGTTTLQNSVITSVSGTKYSIYNVKLVGIDTDEYKALEIYCCAYIIDNGSVLYAGEEIADIASPICYNDVEVVPTTPSTDEETQE